MKDKITWKMKYRDGLTDDNISLHVRGNYERERALLGTTDGESGELFCMAYRVPDGYMYADEEYKRTHVKPGEYCLLGASGFRPRKCKGKKWAVGREYCVPIKPNHTEEIDRLEEERLKIIEECCALMISAKDAADKLDAVKKQLSTLRAEMDK